MVENNVESVREKGRYLETIINRKKRTDCIYRICREQRTENRLASGVWRDDILFEDFRY